MRRSSRGSRGCRGNNNSRGRGSSARRNRSVSSQRGGHRTSEEWTESRITEIVRRVLTEALAGSTSLPAQQQPVSSHTVTANPAAPADGTNYHYERARLPQTHSTRSTNPDFAKLVRGSFNYVKIARAADNWRSLPTSLNKALTRWADNIKPPCSTVGRIPPATDTSY